MTRDEQWLLDEKYGGVATPQFKADKERLAKGEPLAYVIGSQPFLGLKIHLDSKPLIPRPETEWWTEQLLKTWTSGVQVSFLDLCAGSGAIGCAALARMPNAQLRRPEGSESRPNASGVYFGELDPAHEATILKNIRENNLDELRASVRIGDLFEPFGDMQFDIIAANPPYVPAARELPASVADYEPARALYAGEDGLDIIRRIAAELPKHLVKDGTAWIECDSAHAAAACALFAAEGLSALIRTDQYDVPRVIVVSFPA